MLAKLRIHKVLWKSVSCKLIYMNLRLPSVFKGKFQCQEWNLGVTGLVGPRGTK